MVGCVLKAVPNEGACFTIYVPLYTSESEKKKGNRPLLRNELALERTEL